MITLTVIPDVSLIVILLETTTIIILILIMTVMKLPETIILVQVDKTVLHIVTETEITAIKFIQRIAGAFPLFFES